MKAELLILGALHRGPLHPYEIKRRLANALVECYTDVDVGTLYYAIRQLARAGYIAPTRSERVARGGERTIYRVTAEGKARFQELLLARFAEPGYVARTMYSGLLFLHLADRAKLEIRLRQRVEENRAGLEELRRIKAQLGRSAGTGVRYLIEHLIAVREVDRRWLVRLHADVAAGRIRDRLNSAAPTPGAATAARRPAEPIRPARGATSAARRTRTGAAPLSTPSGSRRSR